MPNLQTCRNRSTQCHLQTRRMIKVLWAESPQALGSYPPAWQLGECRSSLSPSLILSLISFTSFFYLCIGQCQTTSSKPSPISPTTRICWRSLFLYRRSQRAQGVADCISSCPLWQSCCTQEILSQCKPRKGSLQGIHQDLQQQRLQYIDTAATEVLKGTIDAWVSDPVRGRPPRSSAVSHALVNLFLLWNEGEDFHSPLQQAQGSPWSPFWGCNWSHLWWWKVESIVNSLETDVIVDLVWSSLLYDSSAFTRKGSVSGQTVNWDDGCWENPNVDSM